MADDIDFTTVSETSVTGCPDPTAGRAIVVPGGPSSTVEYVFRDKSGNPIDLASFADEPKGIRVLLADAFCPCAKVYSADGTVDTGVTGRITFQMPTEVAQRPGIYTTEMWALTNVENLLGSGKYRESTITSVEPSLMLRFTETNNDPGPITLNQVRLQLRDFPGVNEYWQQHEFSAAEIVNSMLLPIQAWNSTPPAVASYNGTNFPYRYEWLEGITANLLKTAAMWMLRNSRTIRYADGTVESDKEKFADYLRIAETKWMLYLQFCKDQKAAINLRSNAGIH